MVRHYLQSHPEPRNENRIIEKCRSINRAAVPIFFAGHVDRLPDENGTTGYQHGSKNERVDGQRMIPFLNLGPERQRNHTPSLRGGTLSGAGSS
jgi:hypothetical protein